MAGPRRRQSPPRTANPVMVSHRCEYSDGAVVLAHWVWCPGCGCVHTPRSRVPETPQGFDECPLWEWDGNTEAPTFAPSLLVYRTVDLCPPEHEHHRLCPNPRGCGSPGHLVISDRPRVLGHHNGHVAEPGNCHSFIRAGHWEFLADSAHALAGQTVPMVPVPDWLVR